MEPRENGPIENAPSSISSAESAEGQTVDPEEFGAQQAARMQGPESVKKVEDYVNVHLEEFGLLPEDPEALEKKDAIITDLVELQKMFPDITGKQIDEVKRILALSRFVDSHSKEFGLQLGAASEQKKVVLTDLLAVQEMFPVGQSITEFPLDTILELWNSYKEQKDQEEEVKRQDERETKARELEEAKVRSAEVEIKSTEVKKEKKEEKLEERSATLKCEKWVDQQKAAGQTNIEIINDLLKNNGNQNADKGEVFTISPRLTNILQNFQRLQAISGRFNDANNKEVVTKLVESANVLDEDSFVTVLDRAYQNVSGEDRLILEKEYPQLRHEDVNIQITPANANTVGDVKRSHAARNDEIEEVKQYATQMSEEIDTVDTEIANLGTKIEHLENTSRTPEQEEELKRLKDEQEAKEQEKEKLEKQKEEAEAILAEVKTEKDDSGSSVLYLRDGLDTTIDEDGDITVHLSDRDIPIHIEDNRPGGYATENEQINAVVFWDAMQNGRGGQMQLSFDLFGDLIPRQPLLHHIFPCHATRFWSRHLTGKSVTCAVHKQTIASHKPHQTRGYAVSAIRPFAVSPLVKGGPGGISIQKRLLFS